MVAKLASDFAKPRGLCEVRAGWERGFLAGLSLAALPGIGPKEAARLKSLGLQEVAQVQGLSEEQLSGLIGPSARLLMRRARGLGSATLRPDRPARSVSRETTLPRDSRDLRLLEGLLIRFVGLIAADLRDQGLVARTVVLKLRHSDFRTVTRRRTLDCPTDLDQELIVPIQGIVKFNLPELNKSFSYLTIPYAQWIFSAPDRITSLSVMVDKQEMLDEVESQLKSLFDETYEVMNWQDLSPELVQSIQIDNAEGIIMLGILYLVIAFGIFGTIMMMTAERVKEYGILISIGMKKWELCLVPIFETIFISFIGVIAGGLVSLPIIIYFADNPIPLTGEYAEAILAWFSV